MQPEAIRGTEGEEVQRLISSNIRSQSPHEILRQLVFMDFDAIITTNYTYEIEDALLDGKWNDLTVNPYQFGMSGFICEYENIDESDYHEEQAV